MMYEECFFFSLKKKSSPARPETEAFWASRAFGKGREQNKAVAEGGANTWLEM